MPRELARVVRTAMIIYSVCGMMCILEVRENIVLTAKEKRELYGVKIRDSIKLELIEPSIEEIDAYIPHANGGGLV
jgi:hypothetical protein